MTSTVIRTPITGIKRTPIISRTPWEKVYAKYVNYVKYAAGRTFLNFHTESAEDLFQEGQIILYKCWLSYGSRSEEEFGKLVKTSIWRKLQEIAGKNKVPTLELEVLQEQGYEPSTQEDWDTPIQNEDNLQKVAQLLKDQPIALTILREFVNPSERTIWEARMDIERKNQLRSQGFVVSIPSTIQPTKKAIQRAMGISRFAFEGHFRIMREAVAQVFCPEKAKSAV